MSTNQPATGAQTENESVSPVKRSAPSLEQLAARYHKDLSADEEPKPTENEAGTGSTDAAPSLRRLGLTGRLVNVTDSSNIPHTSSKKNAIPSLNEIRARLNQRGVDVTSSKWKRGSSPSKSLPSSPEKCAGVLPGEMELEQAETKKHTEALPTKNEPLLQDLEHAHTDPTQETKPETTDKPQAESSSSQNSITMDQYPPQSGQAAAVAGKAGHKHPLQRPWTLYYDGQSHQKPSNSDQYESKLKCIGHFTTLESFFDTFATLHRPSQLGRNTNYHLFKSGIKPMWEDPANAHGGRWVLTLREQSNMAGARAAHEALLDRSWMWLVLGLIGEHFDDDDQVTGAVCSLRAKGDRITLWLRQKEPVEVVNALGNKFLQLLEIRDVPNIQLEFSANDGTKGNYMSLRNAPKPKQEPVAVEDKLPVLNKWLDSELTLHPTDHAWYYAHHTKDRHA